MPRLESAVNSMDHREAVLDRIPVPGEDQLEEGLTPSRKTSPWVWVILACTFGTLLQVPLVTCMCHTGSAKGAALLLGNALILPRALWGLRREDPANSWILYLLLSLSLGIIVTIIAHLAGYH